MIFIKRTSQFYALKIFDRHVISAYFLK